MRVCEWCVCVNERRIREISGKMWFSLFFVEADFKRTIVFDWSVIKIKESGKVSKDDQRQK